MPTQTAIRGAEFGQGALRLAGEVPLSSLDRLCGELQSREGQASYSLQGFVRPDGKPAIRVTVRADLVLTCQRCLGPMTIEVDARRDLVFVPAQALADLEDEEDESDYLPAEERVEPMDVIEDELLLALPIAPKHGDPGCPPGAGGESPIH